MLQSFADQKQMLSRFNDDVKSLLIETDSLILSLIGAEKVKAIKDTLQFSADCLTEMKVFFKKRRRVFDDGLRTPQFTGL